MKYSLLLSLLVVLFVGCKEKKTPMEEIGFPANGDVIQNLVNYLDTTTRTFYIQYAIDSSVAVLTDSATKTEIHIPLK